MYKLKIITGFDAAHQLKGYKGKCENIHGHNWKVEVEVISEKLNEIGIALDFKELKKNVDEVVSQLDHTFINQIPPFTQLNPSSENIARWIYMSLKDKFNTTLVRLYSVTVWESDYASATYME
ncbi:MULTISPECIES: 6-carboxytetrahydropterin synthase QueD [Thermodesulfovibrio]|jgi:6-pyruvoyltetrahydropterin/6-carboxytetrahydropterin synthase|uniref:6-carboxy-5,6,7,8-tetrahydropterin synthase n=2 Tax=Thermodesulfovibrio yellowstonii TaxID=28262 RepID=B5YJJ7_THEYD|nr:MULTISPECIES: 6-carboxytetrahydropterin synthase QueD [Thermodesulfovibrio]ACI21986.1 6-pyruvoyl-tetrahydropterin synthase [Thermodesulfovibrio yellowstonii DSM 11347]MDI6864335.1 6-carboxytetrahydropterin synthase QueD [Thermodesulfovibrio yellowstonii]GLI54061.1 6-carboxy-5,6,7,8-tetrahydropterin synthase [Thermodesulfovibrio islandicus]